MIAIPAMTKNVQEVDHLGVRELQPCLVADEQRGHNHHSAGGDERRQTLGESLFARGPTRPGTHRVAELQIVLAARNASPRRCMMFISSPFGSAGKPSLEKEVRTSASVCQALHRFTT